ncbi:MAG: LysM domain-containing protein [Acidimicrobiales bacterium]
MAAVEVLETIELCEVASDPYLRLVSYQPAPSALRRGVPLQQRRTTRARVLQRRRRIGAVLVLAGAFTILALPGHTFGATTGAGLSNDLAGSSTLASGMDYVVQPGDTLNSIARDMNPVDPSLARSLLVRELGSSVVVPGEHVLIP